MLNRLFIVLLVLAASNVMSNQDRGTSSTGEENTTALAPHVTFDRVFDLFANNIEFASDIKKQFLLAIAVDHTSTHSPHKGEDIGVPYVVAGGAHYWIDRLANKDTSIEVLVNSAILLMFGKDRAVASDATAFKLLSAAADKGYWPANFYVAEYNLKKHLMKKEDNFQVVSSMIGNPSTYVIAQDTMTRFNQCAETGFAPCQFRVGFWLSHSPKTLKDGIEILRNAINITLRDKRYNGILEASVIVASQEIVDIGYKAGMLQQDIFEYEELLSNIHDQQIE